MYNRKYQGFSSILGKTLTEVTGLRDGSDKVTFKFTDGSEYEMYHDQDCCESVDIESVTGDVEDLIGQPLLLAEEVEGQTPDGFNPNNYDSFTWTFYKLATRLGYVDIRWFGQSNGYYSESVSFVKIK